MGKTKTQQMIVVTPEFRKRLRSSCSIIDSLESSVVPEKKSFNGYLQPHLATPEYTPSFATPDAPAENTRSFTIPDEDLSPVIPDEDPSLASPSAAAPDDNKSEEIIPKANSSPSLTKREENEREDNNVTPCSVEERSLSTNTVSTPTSSSQYFKERPALRTPIRNLRPTSASNRVLNYDTDPDYPTKLIRKPVSDIVYPYNLNGLPTEPCPQPMEEDSTSSKDTNVVLYGLNSEDPPPLNGESAKSTVNKRYPYRNSSPIPSKYVAPDGAPPFTIEMLRKIKNTYFGENEDISLSKSLLVELETYHRKEWLSDSVVDCYMKLIRERSAQREDLPKVYHFESTFYQILDDEDGLEQTKETTDKTDIFEFDLAFIPICYLFHWRLVVVNFSRKTIKGYNSLTPTCDQAILCKIERFLLAEYERKHGTNGGNIAWTKSLERDLPQQNNAGDCGVFTLQYAEYLSRGKAVFNFGPENMQYFRGRMLYESLTSKLLTS